MKILSIFFIIVSCSIVNAQKVLTIDEAVKIALKNNYDILVSQNDVNIAKINNTAGNAGMLPRLEITGSINAGQENVEQQLSDGTINQNSALSSTSVNTGAQLSWTLFDGGKMFVTKNKLNEIQALGEIDYKNKVFQTLNDVIVTYYNVVRQKQQLNSINESLKYNRERVAIAQAGFNAGSLYKSDLLMAKIDLNVTNENAIIQQFAIEAALKSLNYLLGQQTNTIFEISDTIPLNYSFNKNNLIEKLNSSNSDILSFQKQIEIAQLSLKESKSNYLPKLDVKVGYYLSQSANSQGSVLNNFSNGPQVNGTINIPIYSAGENKRKVSAAKALVQSSEYELQNIKLQIETIFENTITEFENQQKMLKIEQENNELTKENIKISIERLRLGQTTSLEVRLAQEDYVQSCTRLINFQYNLKVAETKLKQLVSAL
ncbi:MAG: TolC family protein [Paludibacter sp.]